MTALRSSEKNTALRGAVQRHIHGLAGELEAHHKEALEEQGEGGRAQGDQLLVAVEQVDEQRGFCDGDQPHKACEGEAAHRHKHNALAHPAVLACAVVVA